ncbi:putative transcription factor interactor and regulator CCHC(Zn) family protein [Tanacetum coccineum]|uniref:Transcription factor interactor and regulator CCHC(Zn) family protein n=1 Tax=Tanacetum coccineum TaxID=301880 RepID=A0ABQ5E8I0_9ASTR
MSPSGGGGGSSASEANKLIFGDELYLHPTHASSTPLINLKLTGTDNYNVWSHAMTLALHSKNKLGFIDGKCKKPTDKSLVNQWEICNSVVLGWLLGLISEELYLGQIFSKIPSEVWDELKETYDKVNGSVTFDLHHKINTLSQNGSTLSDYYHKLNSLWKQFDALVKLPACTCDAAKGFKTHNDLIKLMQFLMGLDELYLPLRSNILTRDPIPDVKTAFSVICRDESHRGSSSRNKHHAFTFSARSHNEINNKGYNNNKKNVKNSNLICSNPNCGLTGHTVDKCYKIVGYLDHIKRKWANQKTTAQPFEQFQEFQQCSSVYGSPYFKLPPDPLPNDDLEAENHGSEIRSPHVDGTEMANSDDTSSTCNSEATHNEDGTESLDNDHTSLDSDSGATREDHILLYQINNNIVEPSSTSEGNSYNIQNVMNETVSQIRSGRTSKLPTKLSDFVLDDKVKIWK